MSFGAARMIRRPSPGWKPGLDAPGASNSSGMVSRPVRKEEIGEGERPVDREAPGARGFAAGGVF